CIVHFPTLQCQTFLNIRYWDGSNKNIALNALQKITFNDAAGQMNFRLTDATTQIVTINLLQKTTTSDIGEGSTLPVELVAFHATATNTTISLTWKTATEVNNFGFDIERKASNLPWDKIGFIQGSGNSNTPKEYTFTDAPKKGTNFQYRLKQLDVNGKFRYSEIVSINIGTPVSFDLKQNYPNPFNPSTTIAYSIPTESFVTITVYDVLGKQITSLVNEQKKAGSYSVQLDGSRMSSGIYICRMHAAAYTSTTKMILMK
ncbi:MAG TPA: T9SS type A sorting domain-containing protein, partial [Nitrosomonas sp.]|nr:T9SS type A sorting domain-containing protein [Nitrosomonas sp.]